MKKTKIDELINKYIPNLFNSGWYGFKINCDLHNSGFSNLSAPSKQEYCNRIPKKVKNITTFDDTIIKLDKGKPRPAYDLLHCSFNVCPKLKEIRKNNKG
jgi:hypothetical protein